MSLEKILIIKQYLDTDFNEYKSSLETSPEHYSVTTSNNFYDGFLLLRENILHAEQKLSAVIIDTDEVGSQLMELLASLRGINEYSESTKFLPVIVIANRVGVKERKSLSSMASECVIKTNKTNKYLWHLVKSSLERNPVYTVHAKVAERRTPKLFIRRNRKAAEELPE